MITDLHRPIEAETSFVPIPRVSSHFSASLILAGILEGGDVGNHLNEFHSLSRETDPELFYEGLYNLGVRLEQSGHTEMAGRVYSTIVGAGLRPARGQVLDLPLQHRAQQRLAALRGEGSIALRLEVLGRNFARQAMAPAPLIGMGVAGLAFRGMNLFAATRLASLPAGLLTRGPGLRILSGLAGFAAEVPAFTLSGRAMDRLLGPVGAGLALPEAHGSAPLLQEMASAALVLGSLKLFGAAFGRAGQALPLPGARYAVPIPVVLQQAGMLTGIMAGHGLEVAFGLRDRQNASNFLVESLVTLAQFNVAGRLSHSVFGERYERLQRQLAMEAEAVSLRGPKGSAAIPSHAERLLRRFAPRNDSRVRRFFKAAARNFQEAPLAVATAGDPHSDIGHISMMAADPQGRSSGRVSRRGRSSAVDLEKLLEAPEEITSQINQVPSTQLQRLVKTLYQSGKLPQLILHLENRGYNIEFNTEANEIRRRDFSAAFRRLAQLEAEFKEYFEARRSSVPEDKRWETLREWQKVLFPANSDGIGHLMKWAKKMGLTDSFTQGLGLRRAGVAHLSKVRAHQALSDYYYDLFLVREFLRAKGFNQTGEKEGMFLSELLLNGRGNCVSLSLLFGHLANLIGRPLQIGLLPNHLYLVTKAGGAIESTMDYGMGLSQVYQRKALGSERVPLEGHQIFSFHMNNLGKFAMEQGSHAIALNAFHLAQRSLPKNPRAPYQRGRIHLRLGEYENALEAFREIPPLFPPEDRPYHQLRVQAWEALVGGEFSKAELFFKRMNGMDRNDTDVMRGLALVYRRQGREAEAQRLEDMVEFLEI